jgi:hypothetical protein
LLERLLGGYKKIKGKGLYYTPKVKLLMT